MGYIRALIDPGNTAQIFVVCNVAAILGAAVAHYADAPTWTMLPFCLAVVLASPLLVSVRRLEMHAARRAHESFVALLDRLIDAIVRALPAAWINLLRR